LTVPSAFVSMLSMHRAVRDLNPHAAHAIIIDHSHALGQLAVEYHVLLCVLVEFEIYDDFSFMVT
jgi:hypothetical protein